MDFSSLPTFGNYIVCVCFSTGCLNRSWSFYLDITLKFLIVLREKWRRKSYYRKTVAILPLPSSSNFQVMVDIGMQGHPSFLLSEHRRCDDADCRAPTWIHVSCELLKWYVSVPVVSSWSLNQTRNVSSTPFYLKRLYSFTSVGLKNVCRAWSLSPPWGICAVLGVHLFVTVWTAARQAPLSTGVSRQGYWRGLPCPPPVISQPRDWTALWVDSLPAELPGKNRNLGVFLYLVATLVCLRPEFNPLSSNYQREKVTLLWKTGNFSLLLTPK